MRQADEDRFREFAAEQARPLRRAAYLLCGDWHLADDLTQTALVKLYGAWHKVACAAGNRGAARKVERRGAGAVGHRSRSGRDAPARRPACRVVHRVAVPERLPQLSLPQVWVNPATTSETVRWNTFVVRIVGYDSVGKALVEMSTTTVDPAIDNPDTACASNRVGENVTCVRMTPRPDGSTVVILEIDYRPEHTIRYLTRFAVHYRTDGTMVSVWTDRLRSTDGVPDRPTFALTDDQLIALATDPQVHP